MTQPPPRPGPPKRSHLVQQDVVIARVDPNDPHSRVAAHVHCARRKCTMEVEGCAGCQHFARIDVHEAGYILVCEQEGEANLEHDGSAREQEEQAATRSQDDVEQ